MPVIVPPWAVRPGKPGELPCPVCGLTGGFHKSSHWDVDPKYHKEKGWHKDDGTKS